MGTHESIHNVDSYLDNQAQKTLNIMSNMYAHRNTSKHMPSKSLAAFNTTIGISMYSTCTVKVYAVKSSHHCMYNEAVERERSTAAVNCWWTELEASLIYTKRA